MPDSTLSTLEKIRVKIRRITRSPSSSQITDDQIDDYVNSFILYDLPASLKLNTLNKTLTFYTSPNIDTYATNTTDSTDPLYNFKNEYSSIHGPVYIAGRESFLSLSEEEARGIYPNEQYKVNIGTGDGVTTNFTGTLDNVPILQNNVTISSVDTGGDPLQVFDDGFGSLEGDVTVPGTIAYITGTYDVDFDVAPASGETVWIQFVPYTAAKPDTILFKNEEFILRPVPDATYSVEVQGFIRPTELLADSEIPELADWWQYITYGAAIKVFQDRSDFESVTNIAPEFERQELLVNRRTIVQNSGKRASTIYSNGVE